jgi:hypothetical protein
LRQDGWKAALAAIAKAIESDAESKAFLPDEHRIEVMLTTLVQPILKTVATWTDQELVDRLAAKTIPEVVRPVPL